MSLDDYLEEFPPEQLSALQHERWSLGQECGSEDRLFLLDNYNLDWWAEC